MNTGRRIVHVAEKTQIDVVVAGHISLDVTPKFRKASCKTLDKILVPG